jgi:hypothetical protein
MQMKEYEVIRWSESQALQLKDNPEFVLETTTVIDNKQVNRRYSNQDIEIHLTIKTLLKMANINSRSHLVPLETEMPGTYLAFDKYRTQVSELVFDDGDGYFRPETIMVRIRDGYFDGVCRSREFFDTLPSRLHRSIIKQRLHRNLNEFDHIRGLCLVFETDDNSPEYYFHRQHLVREAYHASYGILFFDMPKG